MASVKERKKAYEEACKFAQEKKKAREEAKQNYQDAVRCGW